MLLSWTLTRAKHLELIPPIKKNNVLFHALACAHRAHTTFAHKSDLKLRLPT